jgi:hypothetical protein
MACDHDMCVRSHCGSLQHGRCSRWQLEWEARDGNSLRVNLICWQFLPLEKKSCAFLT